ncbi:glutathione hydrolase 1 proenzyme-like [Babylonia areolata]|uniref:glutathione hydrolase 1 proenzyme-like n=1 Tax=Babylonia areolata TaxID=304850 RepID=UPI003FCF6C83
MVNRRDYVNYSLLRDSYEQVVVNEQRRKRRRLVCVVLVLLVAFGGTVVGLYVAGRNAHSGEDGPTVHEYPHAAVASDVAQCSEIGKGLLQAGGNAVDAAIGTLLCMGLADAQSMGLGGGFFMTVYNRTTQTSMSVDARETAPNASSVDMFEGNPNTSSEGPLSIAVPGEVRGYWLAHQKFGHLPWSQLFAPAIEMAESGFPVPKSLASAFQDSRDTILNELSLREVYVNQHTGELYKAGETIKLPLLAATLKRVAKGGEKAFYNGSLMEDVLADLQDIGSIITRQDLQNYTALLKDAVEITLDDGLRVFSPPPPSSGVILSFILNVLDGYNMTSSDLDGTDNSVRTLHRIVEAFKFAYAKRTGLADEHFFNVAELVANLTSRQFADNIRSKITDNQTHNTSYYGPTYYDRLTTSTAHLSIVDAEGSAVSITSTINGRFGSKRRGRRTGIVFNNEMDDFSSPNITNIFGLRPSPANFIVPGKRPLSSMCPTVIVHPDGDVRLVVGAAGGSRITTATAFVASHELWLGQDIDQAITDLRLHHQLLPTTLEYEQGFEQAILEGLSKLGHELKSVSLGHSIVQAISRHGNLLYAASDFRKGGQPSGY